MGIYHQARRKIGLGAGVHCLTRRPKCQRSFIKAIKSTSQSSQKTTRETKRQALSSFMEKLDVENQDLLPELARSSIPIQHTTNQEVNGGMDMSRTSLSSWMTSMDGSSMMSCSKLQIITPTEFRSKEDSDNSQQAVSSSPPTVSQMIAALKRRIEVSYIGQEKGGVLAGSEDGLVQCLKQRKDKLVELGHEAHWCTDMRHYVMESAHFAEVYLLRASNTNISFMGIDYWLTIVVG